MYGIFTSFAIDLSQMYVNIAYSDGMGTAKLDPFNWCLSTNVKFSSSNSIDLLFYNARNESGPERMVEELGCSNGGWLKQCNKRKRFFKNEFFLWIWQLKFGEDIGGMLFKTWIL